MLEFGHFAVVRADDQVIATIVVVGDTQFFLLEQSGTDHEYFFASNNEIKRARLFLRDFDL